MDAAAALVVAAMTVAGCAEPDPFLTPDRRTSPLTEAVLDAGDAAVVAITFANHAACTGVLVAPRVVLTAAHCLATHSTPPRVLFGSDAAAPRAVIDVAEMYVHANFSPLSNAHDIAGLRLAHDAPAAASPVALVPPSFLGGAEGASVRLVGFGHESDQAGGDAPHVKRQGTAKIATVADAALTLTPNPSQACVGDSGGPVFASVGDNEVLVALVLGGITSCTETVRALRIDSYARSFVEPLVSGVGSSTHRPMADGQSGCIVGSRRPDIPPFMLAAVAAALLLSRKGRNARATPIVGEDASIR